MEGENRGLFLVALIRYTALIGHLGIPVLCFLVELVSFLPSNFTVAESEWVDAGWVETGKPCQVRVAASKRGRECV